MVLRPLLCLSLTLAACASDVDFAPEVEPVGHDALPLDGTGLPRPGGGVIVTDPPPPGDDNGTLANVPAAFANIVATGAKIGFNLNGSVSSGEFTDGGYWHTASGSHFEGVVRGPQNYLYVTGRSNSDLFTIRLGSRQATGSGRLGSNRPPEPPVAGDGVVLRQSLSSTYPHAGGFQALGNYLAIGLEPNSSSESPNSQVAVLSIANPASPTVLYRFDRIGRGSAGTIGWTKLRPKYALFPSGHLMAVGRWGADNIDFYVNTMGVTQNQWLRVAQWNKAAHRSELRRPDGSLDNTWAGYEHMDLVSQSDGTVFLIGTNRNSAGEDWADLWRIDEVSGAVVLTKVGKKHMTCVDRCQFVGAAGVFIDPLRSSLYVYALEQRREGTRSWIKGNEF